MRQQVGGTGGELELTNPIRKGGHYSTLNNTEIEVARWRAAAAALYAALEARGHAEGPAAEGSALPAPAALGPVDR